MRPPSKPNRRTLSEQPIPAAAASSTPDLAIQQRGVGKGEPGLYFVGPHFLHSVSSAMIHGIERDARHVARVILKRLQATKAA